MGEPSNPFDGDETNPFDLDAANPFAADDNNESNDESTKRLSFAAPEAGNSNNPFAAGIDSPLSDQNVNCSRDTGDGGKNPFEPDMDSPGQKSNGSSKREELSPRQSAEVRRLRAALVAEEA